MLLVFEDQLNGCPPEIDIGLFSELSASMYADNHFRNNTLIAEREQSGEDLSPFRKRIGKAWGKVCCGQN